MRHPDVSHQGSESIRVSSLPNDPKIRMKGEGMNNIYGRSNAQDIINTRLDFGSAQFKLDDGDAYTATHVIYIDNSLQLLLGTAEATRLLKQIGANRCNLLNTRIPTIRVITNHVTGMYAPTSLDWTFIVESCCLSEFTMVAPDQIRIRLRHPTDCEPSLYQNIPGDHSEALGKRIDLTRPDYYVDERQIEPISVVNDWGLSFELGNVLKYVSRAGRKKSSTKTIDMKKAYVYAGFELSQILQMSALRFWCLQAVKHRPTIDAEDVCTDWFENDPAKSRIIHLIAKISSCRSQAKAKRGLQSLQAYLAVESGISDA